METDTKKLVKQTVIIVIIIIALTSIGIYFLKSHAENEGKDLMKPMTEASQIQTNEAITDCAALTETQTKDIITLNTIIQKHKQQHKVTFLKLYTYHFVSRKLFLVFSILSALIVFLITQNGWKETSFTVKTLFLIFTAFASLFGLSLSSFDQKVSIHKNGKAYINFDSLQKELINYCVTNADMKGDSITFVKLYAGVSKKVTELHDFYLEFDEQTVDKSSFNYEKED
ncbi:hypothetical protein [Kordia sp.]|uniref:hypothetical protein n=1 Tax=Kordia sp. TaxID=1965332 RepID=UPI003B59EFE8